MGPCESDLLLPMDNNSSKYSTVLIARPPSTPRSPSKEQMFELCRSVSLDSPVIIGKRAIEDSVVWPRKPKRKQNNRAQNSERSLTLTCVSFESSSIYCHSLRGTCDYSAVIFRGPSQKCLRHNVMVCFLAIVVFFSLHLSLSVSVRKSLAIAVFHSWVCSSDLYPPQPGSSPIHLAGCRKTWIIKPPFFS